MSRLQELMSHARGSEYARHVASRIFLAVFSWMWVLQMIVPWWDIWREESSWTVRTVITSLTAIFIATYSFAIYRLNFQRSSWREIVSARERWVLRGILAGIAAVLVIWLGSPWALSLIFVVMTAVITAPLLRAFEAAIQALVFAAVVLVIGQVEMVVMASVLALSTVFGLMFAMHMRQGGVIGQLIEARYAEARMAAAEERLRIAQDLHDVLGHSLSLITLKSELASALADKDPARARREMREVESLARSAMTDVRRTVAAERQPILVSEIDDARQLLEAAGISLDVNGRQEDIPGEIATLFAWGVREGVTNVVRHSRAGHCTISISTDGVRAILTMLDDGAGHDEPDGRPGSGLIGLGERAERLGGVLSFETLPDGTGHRLTLTVPSAERG